MSFFIAEQYCTIWKHYNLSIYQLMNFWVISSLGLSFLLDKQLRQQLLDHIVNMCLTLLKKPQQLPNRFLSGFVTLHSH